MRKNLVIILFACAIFLLSTNSANASLLTFTSKGELYWNVLGLSSGSEDSALEIKKIADDFSPNKNESVALLNDSGKIYLSYGEGGEKVDITGYSQEIVEIEEVDAPRKVFIEATASGFAIKQRGITAETSFPIKINSPQNKLSVATPTGERYLSVMPYEATRLLTSANMITNINGGKINLVEKEEGEVSYEISGQKYITLFKFFTIEVPIKVEVSALSGNVVNVDQPLWYSLVGFFLV